jgi:hypothetical protein
MKLGLPWKTTSSEDNEEKPLNFMMRKSNLNYSRSLSDSFNYESDLIKLPESTCTTSSS